MEVAFCQIGIKEVAEPTVGRFYSNRISAVKMKGGFRSRYVDEDADAEEALRSIEARQKLTRQIQLMHYPYRKLKEAVSPLRKGYMKAEVSFLRRLKRLRRSFHRKIGHR
jgi:hypothetical protein